MFVWKGSSLPKSPLRTKTTLTPAERRIVRLVSAVQFLSILDFQMVMPLGADFARDLHMAASNIGWVTGAYTAAAFVSGIACARALDRMDRRLAMMISLWGLVVSTALGGLAVTYATLVGSRILAGLFSGPAVSLSYALLADHVPEERRGRALGMVASIWSVAGVIGIPVGLKLAEWGSWRTPFFIIAALGVLLVPLLLEAVKRNVSHPRPIEITASQSDKKRTILAFILNFVSIGGNFLVVPNFASYIQLNLGFPRNDLSVMYLITGAVTFFTVRWIGKLTDRFGAQSIILFVTPAVITVYYLLFIDYRPGVSIMLLFVVSGIFNSVRYTVIGIETSKVPQPAERPGFMSRISAAQALGQSMGAFASSLILFDPGHGQRLQHISRVALLTSVIAAAVPFLLIALARMNRRRSGFATAPETLI